VRGRKSSAVACRLKIVPVRLRYRSPDTLDLFGVESVVSTIVSERQKHFCSAILFVFGQGTQLCHRGAKAPRKLRG
jgi:hypothetical protein